MKVDVTDATSNIPNERYLRRHVIFGWWSLLFFVVMGAGLEVMHGLKVGWYLDPSHETRRLMWTLAHAHGTLLALINVVFGLSTRVLPAGRWCSGRLTSSSLIGATVLLPGGFLLGGMFVYGGDPGLGILLVPIGALLLLVSIVLTALAAHRILS